MRKRLLILVALIVSFTSVFPVSAAQGTTNLEAKFKQTLTSQQLEYFDEFKDNGGSMEVLNNKQKAEIHTSGQKIDEIKKHRQHLNKNYRESGDTSIAATDDGSSFYFQHKIYDHKKKDKIIITTTFYNAETEEIVRYVTSELDDLNNLTDVNQEIIYSNLESSEFGTYDFNWNGDAFACGVIGLAACGSFCWALKNSLKINTNIVCTNACSVAFIIGCM